MDPRRFGYEGNPDGSVRLVHNVPGMWLLEQCRAEWKRTGVALSYTELLDAARACAAFPARVDPYWSGFVLPDSMLRAIRDHLDSGGQAVPGSPGEYTMAILGVLAESYATALDEMRYLTGRRLSRLVVVGGVARNGLLNELTTRAAQVQVVPGPAEATLLGNVQNQLLALRNMREPELNAAPLAHETWGSEASTVGRCELTTTGHRPKRRRNWPGTRLRRSR